MDNKIAILESKIEVLEKEKGELIKFIGHLYVNYHLPYGAMEICAKKCLKFAVLRLMTLIGKIIITQKCLNNKLSRAITKVQITTGNLLVSITFCPKILNGG